MMIKAKNIIMKERIWINGVINETTFETHCAIGHFLPVLQHRNVDDCRVHKCVPIQGVQDCTSQHTGDKPNNVWSDLKHVRAHEHGVVQWSTALEEVRKL